MLRLSRGFCLIVAALVSACRPTALPHTIAQGSSPDPRPNDGEWIAYGRDAFGGRFSPLTQIDRTNVGRLTMAWTYRTGEMEERFATPRETSFEATPLMVDGTLYLSTPLGRVIALDPSTGTERWVFDPQVPRNVRFGDFANRGVSTWVDRRVSSGSPCARRIYVATIDARLAAVDARTGAPCADFGVGGIVNLRSGLHNAPSETAEYEMTSPPAVIGDLLVVGSSVADNNRTDAASGEVRALDARTGALRWSWDPVPRDSADAAWRTWTGPSAHRTGAANAWSVIAADAARDLVFVPTSSPSPDYFGGERLGDNRYANSIVALRASTGRVVWSFQTVHHDIWDYDNASPPALVTITKNGRRVDAVLQATKTGQLFVLDRDTGAPLFPVEERSVPTSTVPGEHASPTQPFQHGDTAAQSSALLARLRVGRHSVGSRGVSSGNRRLAQRWRVHATELRGQLCLAEQYRRRPLGRGRLRSRARDRHRAGESSRRRGTVDTGREARRERATRQLSPRL